jgi:hypothetical protein
MPDPTSLARWLVLIGLGLAGLGGIVWLIGRAGVHLGSLPGDVQVNWGGATCFLPLASSIVLSLILTVLVNLILRALHK